MPDGDVENYSIFRAGLLLKIMRCCARNYHARKTNNFRTRVIVAKLRARVLRFALSKFTIWTLVEDWNYRQLVMRKLVSVIIKKYLFFFFQPNFHIAAFTCVIRITRKIMLCRTFYCTKEKQKTKYGNTILDGIIYFHYVARQNTNWVVRWSYNSMALHVD